MPYSNPTPLPACGYSNPPLISAKVSSAGWEGRGGRDSEVGKGFVFTLRSRLRFRFGFRLGFRFGFRLGLRMGFRLGFRFGFRFGFILGFRFGFRFGDSRSWWGMFPPSPPCWPEIVQLS